jgi:anti-sigma B factor antagonist
VLRVKAIEPDDEGPLILEVAGEIDLASNPELRERMHAAFEDGHTRIVVDASKVTFIDSTGLFALSSGAKQARRHGGRLAVVAADPNVLRIFEITGMDEAFPICQARDSALEAVQQD